MAVLKSSQIYIKEKSVIETVESFLTKPLYSYVGFIMLLKLMQYKLFIITKATENSFGRIH